MRSCIGEGFIRRQAARDTDSITSRPNSSDGLIAAGVTSARLRRSQSLKDEKTGMTDLSSHTTSVEAVRMMFLDPGRQINSVDIAGRSRLDFVPPMLDPDLARRTESRIIQAVWLIHDGETWLERLDDPYQRALGLTYHEDHTEYCTAVIGLQVREPGISTTAMG